jgi:hypothetical protein
MPYKMTIWLFVPVMLMNGLWMVCDPAGSADPPMTAEERADCIRICAALEKEFGKICIIWPGANTSISVIDYGAAILTDEILVAPTITEEQLLVELPASRWDPTLSHATPPPRA